VKPLCGSGEASLLCHHYEGMDMSKLDIHKRCK
jgi:hypothetical protein